MGEDQDIHDLRGEIGGVRTDIRTLRDEVRAGFEKMNGRVRMTEDAINEARIREDERSKLVVGGQLLQTSRPHILKDSRTYAVGGIGSALAFVVLEFLEKLAPHLVR